MTNPKPAADLLMDLRESINDACQMDARCDCHGHTKGCQEWREGALAQADAAVEAARDEGEMKAARAIVIKADIERAAAFRRGAREGADPTLHHHPMCLDMRIAAEQSAFRRGAREALSRAADKLAISGDSWEGRRLCTMIYEYADPQTEEKAKPWMVPFCGLCGSDDPKVRHVIISDLVRDARMPTQPVECDNAAFHGEER